MTSILLVTGSRHIGAKTGCGEDKTTPLSWRDGRGRFALRQCAENDRPSHPCPATEAEDTRRRESPAGAPGTQEPIANPVRPIRVLVVDADARVLTALRATVSSNPDLELLGAVPDAATALAGDAETSRVVALADVGHLSGGPEPRAPA